MSECHDPKTCPVCGPPADLQDLKIEISSAPPEREAISPLALLFGIRARPQFKPTGFIKPRPARVAADPPADTGEPSIDCELCGPQPPQFNESQVRCSRCGRFAMRRHEFDRLTAEEAAAPAVALTPEYFARRRAIATRAASLTS